MPAWGYGVFAVFALGSLSLALPQFGMPKQVLPIVYVLGLAWVLIAYYFSLMAKNTRLDCFSDRIVYTNSLKRTATVANGDITGVRWIRGSRGGKWLGVARAGKRELAIPFLPSRGQEMFDEIAQRVRIQ